MAKLSGAEQVQRGKELKPARLMAFKLWQENPQMTPAELDQALKTKGFEIGKTTRATWLMRFRKGSTVRTYRGSYKARKPKPARELAFKLWQENPRITGTVLQQLLKEKGFQVSTSACYYWLKSFKKGKDVGTYEEKPVTAVEPSEKFTLEQIIEAAGSVEALSVLFYQGVMRELTRKDANIHLLKQECIDKNNSISSLKRELDEVTRDRNKIMREWNEKLAKVKVGTLTLDETTHRLVAKL